MGSLAFNESLNFSSRIDSMEHDRNGTYRAYSLRLVLLCVERITRQKGLDQVKLLDKLSFIEQSNNAAIACDFLRDSESLFHCKIGIRSDMHDCSVYSIVFLKLYI